MEGKTVQQLSSYSCNLNSKTLTSFVGTKARVSVVITKPLALRMSLRARKATWLYYMDLYVTANNICHN